MPDPTTTTAEINGFPCRVWQKGSGPKLGFLAGFGGLPRWIPFLDALARERTVIVPSMPGFRRRTSMPRSARSGAKRTSLTAGGDGGPSLSLRSVHRAGWFCVCELQDGIGDPKPCRGAVVVAFGQ